MTATQRAQFTGWLWLAAFLVIALAAWVGAGVILWLVYP